MLELPGPASTSGAAGIEAVGTAREVLVGNERKPGSIQTGAEAPGADPVAPLLRPPARHPAALPASARDSKAGAGLRTLAGARIRSYGRWSAT